MIAHVLNIALWFGLFGILDRSLTACGIQGVYYGVHAIHNALMVQTTAPEVWLTLTDFPAAIRAPSNMYALELCFALHFYHCALYWRKFRLDDWLHHILMIGIALPIGGVVPSATLLGFSLFFTTGLPGGIDYVLLFLQRNGWISRDLEKRVNTQLNVWIRSPGCVANAALTLAMLSSIPETQPWHMWAGTITAALNFWNGQYFMQQVVWDAGSKQISAC